MVTRPPFELNQMSILTKTIYFRWILGFQTNLTQSFWISVRQNTTNQGLKEASGLLVNINWCRWAVNGSRWKVVGNAPTTETRPNTYWWRPSFEKIYKMAPEMLSWEVGLVGPSSKKIQRNVKGHYRTSFGQKKSKFQFMDGDFRTALVYMHMYNCNGELRKPSHIHVTNL